MANVVVIIVFLALIFIVLYIFGGTLSLVIFGIFAAMAILAAVLITIHNHMKKESEKMLIALKQKEQEEEKCRQEAERRRQDEEAKRKREAFLREKRSEFKAAVDSLPMYKITLTDNKHNRNQEIDIVDKQYKNITKASAVIKLKDFIAVDVETTGLKTGGNDIIQLSAIKYRDFKATEAFDAYIKPRKPIPKEATEINGITDEMVNDAPRFYQIIDCFNEFIEDLPLVAHNAPFDIKHLFVNGLDSVVDKTVYDTLELSRKAYKDEYSYKLTDICEANNIYPTSSHDSLYDSYAAGELFKCIVADIKGIDIDDLFVNE